MKEQINLLNLAAKNFDSSGFKKVAKEIPYYSSKENLFDSQEVNSDMMIDWIYSAVKNKQVDFLETLLVSLSSNFEILSRLQENPHLAENLCSTVRNSGGDFFSRLFTFSSNLIQKLTDNKRIELLNSAIEDLDMDLFYYSILGYDKISLLKNIPEEKIVNFFNSAPGTYLIDKLHDMMPSIIEKVNESKRIEWFNETRLPSVLETLISVDPSLMKKGDENKKIEFFIFSAGEYPSLFKEMLKHEPSLIEKISDEQKIKSLSTALSGYNKHAIETLHNIDQSIITKIDENTKIKNLLGFISYGRTELVQLLHGIEPSLIEKISDKEKIKCWDKAILYGPKELIQLLHDIEPLFIKRVSEEQKITWVYSSAESQRTNSLDIVKILFSFEPLLINSVNTEGESMGHYFNHDKDMLQWLFCNGYIPHGDEYVKKKEHKLSDIKGNQTVHDPRINDANNFYIKILKQESDYKPDPADAQKLFKSIKDYSGFVSAFSKKLPFDFLSLKYIKQALTDKESLQHTKSFLEGKTSEQTVAGIVEIVLNALHDKYLKVGSSYGDYTHQYDYSDEKYKVTLKELILGVYNATLNRVLSIEEVHTVLVDTIKHNIADSKVLELIGLQENTGNESLYSVVSIKTIEESSKIFETITGASLKDYISHKDLFTMMCQLFKAATTYGDNNDACKHGITTQVAQTLCMVDSKYIEKYSKHQATKTDQLNEHNISGIVEKILESLLSKEDPKFAKELSDFAIIGNTNKMPIIVIKAVNTAFLEIASEQLPYFKTHIPTVEDYSLLIQSIRVNKSFVNGVEHEHMGNESNELVVAESYTQLNPFSEAMKELQIKQAVAAALGYVLDEIEYSLAGEVENQDYT